MNVSCIGLTGEALELCLKKPGLVKFEFQYSGFKSLEIENCCDASVVGKWRYDEFRIAANGDLIHEIEWAHGTQGLSTWRIEARDVSLSHIEPKR